jgi:hypothetical protein
MRSNFLRLFNDDFHLRIVYNIRSLVVSDEEELMRRETVVIYFEDFVWEDP